MPYAYQTFAGDDVSTFFPVSFPYLARQQVRLYYDYDLSTGASSKVLGEGADYDWTNDTTIQLNSPVPAGTDLTIIRQTPLDNLIVQWTDASNMTEEALNTAQLQWLYLLQEIIDRGGIAGVPGGGNAIDIIDSLTSTRTDAALSANQGRILRSLVGGGGFTDIIDNLSSIRTDAALSANQGRVLDQKIAAVAADLANFKIEADLRIRELEAQVNNPGDFLGDPEFAPIGAIRWQPCGSPPLEGWIEAEGQIKSRNVYSPLFNVIGEKYGAGNGTTTFRFPDRSQADPAGTIAPEYCPYIKFGTRFALTVSTFFSDNESNGSTVPAYRAADFDETAATLNERALQPTDRAMNMSYMSQNGKFLVGVDFNDGTNRVFAWRNLQLNWSEVVVENQDVYIDADRCFTTRDGTYLLATSDNDVIPWRVWKWNESNTSYDLSQEGWADKSDFEDNSSLCFYGSYNGTYAIVTDAFGSFAHRLAKVENNTWSVVSPIPDPPTSFLPDFWVWHNTDNFAIALRATFSDETIILYRRVGDQLTYERYIPLTASEISGFTVDVSRVAFNEAGTQFAVGWWGNSFAGVDVFDFNPLTGETTLFTSMKNPQANYGTTQPFYNPGSVHFVPGKTDRLLVVDDDGPNDPHRAYMITFNGSGIVGDPVFVTGSGLAEDRLSVGDSGGTDDRKYGTLVVYSDEF